MELSTTRDRGRFEVKSDHQCEFLVQPGAVTVTGVGTMFAVELVAVRLGVTTEEGAVLVVFGIGQSATSCGRAQLFSVARLQSCCDVARRMRNYLECGARCDNA